MGGAPSYESISYIVAKHGVVALTRSLGHDHILRKIGIKVQCLCPSFADTAIISDNAFGVKETLKKVFGLMTPECVGEAFIKLIKSGSNGSAMAVGYNMPPCIITDYSRKWLTFLALGAKTMK